MIETAETACACTDSLRRSRDTASNLATHREHKDFSAVTHIASGKGIPPFLILYVNDHPDTSIQAQRLGAVLKEAGITSTLFGAKRRITAS